MKLRKIMIRCIGVLLVALSLIITVAIADDASPSLPGFRAEISTPTELYGVDNITLKSKLVQILGVDPTGFPMIKVNIYSSKFCAMAGGLKKEDFTIEEDGNSAAIDNFYCTCNASGQKLDLAVVFDDTGSMQRQIDIMKSKVKNLIDKIRSSGVDANYSLVSFKDTVSVRTNWTGDAKVFTKSIDSLHATGGGDVPENSLDAIEAVLSMGFRPGAQKVILVITDTYGHYLDDGNGFSKYTIDEVERDLKMTGVIFIPVSPAFEKPRNVDLKDIASQIQSMWIDMESADFSAIMDQFQWIVIGSYMIEYTSSDLTPSEKRTVAVTINAPGCLKGGTTNSYIKPIL